MGAHSGGRITPSGRSRLSASRGHYQVGYEGNQAAGLTQDPYGGLTIYLQPGSPGQEREPNRLPTSAEHPWFVILRMYRPQPTMIEPSGSARTSPRSRDTRSAHDRLSSSWMIPAAIRGA